MLGTLLRRYRLRLASLRPDKGKVRATNSGPAHGVRMIVEERRAGVGGRESATRRAIDAGAAAM